MAVLSVCYYCYDPCMSVHASDLPHNCDISIQARIYQDLLTFIACESQNMGHETWQVVWCEVGISGLLLTREIDTE